MVLAHAFGQRYDLPIPLLLFVLGGALVVIFSFLLVLRRGDDGRLYDDTAPDVPGPAGSSRLLGALSLVGLVFLVWVGISGTQDVSENLLPTVFWLLVWIAVPLSCGLIGDWTRPVNPFSALATAADRPGLRRTLLARSTPVGWPQRLGWWPAVALFFLLACGELVFNLTATTPRVIAAGLLVYAVINLTAGLLFGTAWLARGEVFTVLFATWGRLGWFRFGAPGRRGFIGGLWSPFDAAASRIAFVLLLLISVNFDGLLATPWWASLERSQGLSGDELDAFRVAAFVVLAVLVTLVFGTFAYAAARMGRHDVRPAAALAGRLPTRLPIAFGYLLAHTLQYLLVNGQLLGPLLGNPTGNDSWPVHLPYPFNEDYDPKPA